MLIKSIRNLKSQPIFFDLSDYIANQKLYLKLEGYNAGFSIKFKTALKMIEDLEKQNKIEKDTVFIESTSGNLGIALSVICREKGYSLICVSDPKILPNTEKLIQKFGAKLIKVTNLDENNGYLLTRTRLVEKLIKKKSNYIWLDQYSNQSNWKAHFETTAKEVFSEFNKVDYLFVGTGTTGTIMGCAHYIKEYQLQTKLIAVDVRGSLTFTNKPYARYIPGLGTSRRPNILDRSLIDDVVIVTEEDTIQVCHELLKKKALFLGGSSGSILSGVKSFSKRIPKNSKIVALSPDFGINYLDTIYNELWVKDRFKEIQTNTLMHDLLSKKSQSSLASEI